MVLGRPGAGCTTLLRTLANQRDEYYAIEGEVHYDSFTPEEVHKYYRGDIQYSPEDDVQRLFNVCRVGRGNAELLNEVLVYAKPQELRNDITKVLRFPALFCSPRARPTGRYNAGAPWARAGVA